MEHWKIILDGHGQAEGGDVIPKDGEIIGKGHVKENDFYEFTPIGENEPRFVDPMLGPFCPQVLEWFESQQ